MSDETKTIADLRPAPYNPRMISDPKLAALDKAMRTFGDLSGIVFNRTTGQLVGGHQRVKNLPPDAPITITHRNFDKDGRDLANAQGTIAVGYVDVSGERWLYREVEWDETTERAANVAANQHGGTWDETLLADLLTELQAGGYDMELAGFNDVELSRILSSGPTDPVAEWEGMPEYQQDDQTAFRSITVHFKDQAAVNQFLTVLGATITEKVKFLWYPAEQRQVMKNLRYANEP